MIQVVTFHSDQTVKEQQELIQAALDEGLVPSMTIFAEAQGKRLGRLEVPDQIKVWHVVCVKPRRFLFW